ncbi:hypothetical protein [Leifsonia sp. A12D58]|uniref:hypothetical protein n=1 Tax=Leifsonia sp. A12D58 TaxID=3397674 RepID=UPI0039E19CE7
MRPIARLPGYRAPSLRHGAPGAGQRLADPSTRRPVDSPTRRLADPSTRRPVDSPTRRLADPPSTERGARSTDADTEH